ncbi:MAG: GrpB family protein [Burkholderiales bacterium]
MAPDETVELSAPDPAWSQHFDQESIKLVHALVVRSSRVEHIGSTAVPALLANPIVDIMVGVDSYPPPPEFLAPLAQMGYEPLGEAGVPARLCFCKRGSQAFNLHVVQFGNEHWRNNLLLRDYLRAHALEVARYGQLKHRIIATGATRSADYAAKRNGAIAALMKRARTWHDAVRPGARKTGS